MKIKLSYWKLLKIQGNILQMIEMWPQVKVRVRTLAETEPVLQEFMRIADSTYRMVTGKPTPE